MTEPERIATIRELLRSNGATLRKMRRDPATSQRLDVQLADAVMFLLVLRLPPVEPDVERLRTQALTISEMLSDAGIGPCTLPEGVRQLIARLPVEDQPAPAEEQKQ